MSVKELIVATLVSTRPNVKRRAAVGDLLSSKNKRMTLLGASSLKAITHAKKLISKALKAWASMILGTKLCINSLMLTSIFKEKEESLLLQTIQPQEDPTTTIG